MEGAMTTAELTILIALVGLMVAVVTLLSGIWFRPGQISNRVGELERRFDQQVEDHGKTRDETRQEMRDIREEFRQELRGAREELRQEMQETREEFRQEFREMREEIRRNHQQLLQALAHHTHDPATGFAIFSIPPGTENPAG